MELYYDYRYNDTLRLVREGITSVSGNRIRHPSSAYDLAKEWFRLFAFMSDIMPTTNCKHLPSCLSKRSVYIMYKEDMGRKGETRIISERHFVGRMWKKEFPNVVIPKVGMT